MNIMILMNIMIRMNIMMAMILMIRSSSGRAASQYSSLTCLCSLAPLTPHTLLPSITLGNLTCNILLKILFSKSSLEFFQSNPR